MDLRIHRRPTDNVAQILINLAVLLLPPTIQETQSALLWPDRHHQEYCCERLPVLQERSKQRPRSIGLCVRVPPE